MKTKKIQYDDDIVIVYNSNGDVIYKGLEDYEPYNDEDWRWSDEIGGYTFGDMVKKCIEF